MMKIEPTGQGRLPKPRNSRKGERRIHDSLMAFGVPRAFGMGHQGTVTERAVKVAAILGLDKLKALGNAIHLYSP
jgi:hypothetical protein